MLNKEKARLSYGLSPGARECQNLAREGPPQKCAFFYGGRLLCFWLLSKNKGYGVAQGAVGGVRKACLEAWVQWVGIGEGGDERGKQAFH